MTKTIKLLSISKNCLCKDIKSFFLLSDISFVSVGGAAVVFLLCRRRTTQRKEKANITIKFYDFYESTASCVLVDVDFIDDFMAHTR